MTRCTLRRCPALGASRIRTRRVRGCRESRVVVTRDADFRHSHTVSKTPRKSLVVATGNIRNDDLLALFEQRLAEIVTAFASTVFVELHRDVLVVHGSGSDRSPLALPVRERAREMLCSLDLVSSPRRRAGRCCARP